MDCTSFFETHPTNFKANNISTMAYPKLQALLKKTYSAEGTRDSLTVASEELILVAKTNYNLLLNQSKSKATATIANPDPKLYSNYLSCKCKGKPEKKERERSS